MSNDELEARLTTLESLAATMTSGLKECVRIEMSHTQQIIDCRESILSLLSLIYQLHPELKTPKNIGIIHSLNTRAEFDQAGVDELLGKLKKLLPPRPEDPPPPTVAG